MKNITIVAFVTLASLAPAFAASSRSDAAKRSRRANQVFEEVMQTPDQGIPKEILEGAQCVAIVPGQKKFAMGFGGTYGKGVATCRNRGTWSAPIFIQVGGGSWGLQLGGQSTDVIMVFRTQEGLTKLLADKVKLGVGLSAAAGPVGRQASASTDASLHAEILTYSRSRGLFAGVSLNGDMVQPDDSGNRAMYGDKGWRNILAGHATPTASGRPLLASLGRYSAEPR